ncbi:MAG: dihydroorotase, partial [Coriobacteriia bacterium]|nr:dihydroorotase [Coriobacteriia bacterium]
MALLLKNLRCIDPSAGLDEVTNIAIKDGKITKIGPNASIDKGETRDMSGKIALPGLIDMHVHLRDPGLEYKEDLASGGRAAAAGGFTAVLAMPNTSPTISDASLVAHVLEKAQRVTKTRVHVAGSLTRGLKGESLSEIGDMYSRGAVAFTDDGRGVQDNGILRLAMDYCKQFGVTILSHCQDETLAGKGVVNEGVVSTRLGLTGWPAVAEELPIARDIALAELTGCAVHIQHLSTARGVELVQAAKERGLPLTCEVAPHHLFCSEDDLDTNYNTSLKMNPPLRTREDNEALQAALIAGVIDCVATDHAPHAAHEKSLEFELAPFGTTGLETALSLVLHYLVRPGLLS